MPIRSLNTTKLSNRGKFRYFSTIGSQVGIHGIPIGNDNWMDQRIKTWGCPFLKTKDTNELYGVVQMSTIAEILA
ncbi:MAG: hypothetical protein B0A82_03640 [Alkalinema sp. CACIAM 70d]|nr:MAG: hypothetical protein B0A82_03640 [Alkalinema sp. CACIAM 70d]